LSAVVRVSASWSLAEHQLFAPTLALGAFVSVVTISLNMNYALAVDYNESSWGNRDESVLTGGGEVQSRIVFEDYIRREGCGRKLLHRWCEISAAE
jgi:hypothetical protein